MRKTRFAIALAIVMLAAQTIWAFDINGKWIAKVPARGGKTSEIVFNFQMDGDKLTGTVSGATSHILEGKINGDEISFLVVVKAAGMKVGYDYSGKISGNQIKFTRTRSTTGGEATEFIARRQ